MFQPLKTPKRNRRGVTIIELTISMIVLIFLALASFFTLSNLSSDAKAEASVSALEKMTQWRDSVVARGDAAAIAAFNALTGPADTANIAILQPVLGSNFRPQAMQISLTSLCTSTKITSNIKNRVATALGQASAAGVCDATAVTGNGFDEGGYPVVANTGTNTSPFLAAL
jgi:type II secretory pathway pseudopilin PulG